MSELLLISEVDNYDSIGKDFEVGAPIKISTEFSYIATNSFPLIISFLLQYLLSVTSIYACGQLGARELAAASLAICTFNITGLLVYQGMATSLDALCSQAYGLGKHELVGVYFQRCSTIIMVITVAILLPIWWFSGALLLFIIADTEVVALTQLYLRYHIIGTPALLLFETGKRFLQAQNIYNASTWILAVVVPLNYVLNWVLVWNKSTGLGYIGAPIAIALSYWATTLLMLAYVLFVDGRKCWSGFSIRSNFDNWGPILHLAIPGIVMVEAEYLAFEVLTILSAAFGTESLAAQAIAANTGTMAFQLPFAISVAISTRLGNYIGMGHIEGARLVAKLTTYIAVFVAFFNFSLLYFGRHVITRVFTNDPKVIVISDYILVYVAINQLFDVFNVLAAGLLRGQGRQKIGSYLNLGAYYVIALPFAFILSYHVGMGLRGLWVGLSVGVFFLAVLEFGAVYFSDWEGIVRKLLTTHGA